MKKYFTLFIMLTLILLSSCILFQYINQPTIALPNDIFTVSIAATTEGGDQKPYFGVCLPIGWTIPGDSLQCSGVYNEVIYYDSLISSEQEYASPAPAGYYWWAGKGDADTSAIGVVYGDLQIQTDSQIGTFSIDYMLGHSGGCGSGGVNLQRSNDHLIQIAEGAVITSVSPDQGYQNFSMDISIDGFNTHFSDGPGTQNVWLSQNGNEIYANSFIVHSNTSLTANFYIPLNSFVGLWNVNVETYIDSIITRANGFEILPPPPLIFVSPDSIEMVLEPGSTGTKTLTISNTGGSDLHFNIAGPNNALQFDGVDDYLNMGDDIDLANSSFTLEAWAKRSVIGFYHMIWGQGIAITNQGLHVGFRENDVFTIAFYDNDLNTPADYTGLDWHHWACTFDASTKVRKIFRDGLAVANDVATDDYQGGGTFYIGTAAWFNDYFDGIIDEVRLWDRARSDVQIQENMYRELLGIEQGLVGYWQFNEGIGDTAFDKTSFGNNGILQGGAIWSDSYAPLLSLPGWLYLEPGSGICDPNSAIDITVLFDATELDTGDYYFTPTVLSNDPFHPIVTIPVHMLVSTTSGVGNQHTLPTEFRLEQNYPNPFNPTTTIQYSIKERSSVELILYDVLGREVDILVNEEQNAGLYNINFNAGRLTSGIYFYRIQAGEFVESKKMILLK